MNVWRTPWPVLGLNAWPKELNLTGATGSDSERFGRRILGLPPEAVLRLEKERSLDPALQIADSVTTKLVRAALAGERLIELQDGTPYDRVVFLGLSEEDKSSLVGQFALEAQQQRGAWFLPEEARVSAGLANLGHYLTHYPRFAVGCAYGGIGKVDFRHSPLSLFLWAVLEPLFSTLFRPFALRGPRPVQGDSDEQRAIWNDVRQAYAALGLETGKALKVFTYGGGWGSLTAPEQLVARRALLAELRDEVDRDVASRFRIWRSQELVERYYAKARRSKPEMRQVLTKSLQLVLAGGFAGDWNAFLKYLGEDASLPEEVPTSLPEMPVPVDMERDSPIQRRVEVMRAFWTRFDEVHSKQTPGMPSLWGFVADGESCSLGELAGERSGPAWYHPESYRTHLSAQILASIDSLWDGTLLARYPEGIATTIDPYARICDALGPALHFWHGAALTAWFVSEGPYSRTDMAGLAEYFHRDLDELRDLGCAVDPELFEELISAEKKLGKPEAFDEKDKKVITRGGLSVTFSVSSGSRRSGFESLNAILTRHRQIWADRNLDNYLRTLWRSDLDATAREYGKFLNVKGKLPTLKQFADFAEDLANLWFNGDLTQVYSAIGQQCPTALPRRRLLSRPVNRFAFQIFTNLGGKPTRWEDLAATIRGRDRSAQDAAWRDHGNRVKLAELSVSYVQIREALGRPPSLKEFGIGRFKAVSSSLDKDIERAWAIYVSAIERSIPR